MEPNDVEEDILVDVVEEMVNWWFDSLILQRNKLLIYPRGLETTQQQDYTEYRATSYDEVMRWGHTMVNRLSN